MLFTPVLTLTLSNHQAQQTIHTVISSGNGETGHNLLWLHGVWKRDKYQTHIISYTFSETSFRLVSLEFIFVVLYCTTLYGCYTYSYIVNTLV